MIEGIEYFCEKHGFDFHTRGRGRYGIHSYWSFGSVMEYVPETDYLRLTGLHGEYKGRVESIEHLEEILKALRMEDSSILNPEQAKRNTGFKFVRKMEMANRMAARIFERYGFRNEKCVHMAMQSKWWNDLKYLSQMTNRAVDEGVQQVFDDIEHDVIM